jgi:hypothetical protein
MSNFQEVFEEIKLALSGVKVSEAILDNQKKIQFTGEKIALKGIVKIKDDKDKYVKIADGAHATVDGVKFSTVDGKVSEIVEVKAAENTDSTASPDVSKAQISANVDVNDLITLAIANAIQPINESIYGIQETLAGLTTLINNAAASTEMTKTALSKVTEIVEVIANQPSADPIKKELPKEKKEVKLSKEFENHPMSAYFKS